MILPHDMESALAEEKLLTPAREVPDVRLRPKCEPVRVEMHVSSIVIDVRLRPFDRASQAFCVSRSKPHPFSVPPFRARYEAGATTPVFGRLLRIVGSEARPSPRRRYRSSGKVSRSSPPSPE